MRELTKEELELAPSWATMYKVVECEIASSYTLFTDGKNRSQWIYHDTKAMSPISIGDIARFDTKPINRKPFDIREHVFGDHIVSGCHLSNDLCVVFREQSFGLNIKKQDAIAIAKALGVTGEDLQ